MLNRIVCNPATQDETGASEISKFSPLKARQQATWASGDFAVIGTTLQIVGEELCEALDVRSGSRVLDVAAGNGNVSLAAARRWCEVVATDYVPALLKRGRERGAHLVAAGGDARAVADHGDVDADLARALAHSHQTVMSSIRPDRAVARAV